MSDWGNIYLSTWWGNDGRYQELIDSGALPSPPAPVADDGELVVNGTFDSFIGWGDDSGSGTGWSIGSGSMNFNTGVSRSVFNAGNVEAGKTYEVIFTIKNYVSGNFRMRLGTAATTVRSANGTYTQNVVANNTPIEIQAYISFVGSVDDISVKEVV